jgi:DNA invertase Pin-like site-specific DNA recombinase
MVDDLQPGEVVVAEKIDRISRLPLAEAERLVAAIRAKGARLAVPGIIDLSELVAGSAGVARIVLEAVQEMLLRVALQTARADYEDRRERQRQGIQIAKREGRYTGRKADHAQRRRIVALREAGMSIAETAELTPCSPAQVKRVTALHRGKLKPDEALSWRKATKVTKVLTLGMTEPVRLAQLGGDCSISVYSSMEKPSPW